jgi:transcription antitermination factor NusG
LFVRTKLRWTPVAYSPGIARPVGNRGAPPDEVPDTLVDSIRAREGKDGYVRLPRRASRPRPPGIYPGDRVRVVHGPLFGQDGLVAGMVSHQRVVVLLAALGKVTMPRGDVVAV